LATYVIGDLQGCLSPLKILLDKLKFDDKSDKLWFVGDIVNRGPESLEALRYVKALGDAAITVLGNHDLHLLAVINGIRKTSSKDTLDDILDAPDIEELVHWLRQQPLIHTDKQLNATLAHAGIYPFWSLEKAHTLAEDTQAMLSSDTFFEFLPHMYGNTPRLWDDALVEHDRWRFVINAFTRMRYCQLDGSLDYDFNGPPAIALARTSATESATDSAIASATAPKNSTAKLLPWYAVENRIPLPTRIVFGHWSSHPAIAPPNIIPTDRGCVWGGPLTAYHVEQGFSYTINHHQLP